MSDKHTSYTPIVVGVVIALLGVLTGLYIADNAWQQLAQNEAPETNAAEAQQSAQQEEDQQLPALNLEPLAPVVVDEPVAEIEEELPVPDVPEADVTPIPAEEPARPLSEETDDFEEVPIQEIEQAAANQHADSL